MVVKVNSVMVPGVNADHLPAVARRAKELGAHIVNVLPLIPVPGTPFESLRAPTAAERRKLQDECGADIRQMRHCRQCRADAIGLLGQDRSAEFAGCGLRREGRKVRPEADSAVRVAVASSDGRVIDGHFGMAERFRIYSVRDGQVREEEPIDVAEHQDIPLFGPGHRTKMESTVDKLAGTSAVITLRFGKPAVELLKESGIEAIEAQGDVREAVLRAATKAV